MWNTNDTNAVDLSHLAAMLSLRRIRCFVFAGLASPTRECSSRLAVQKQNFLFSRDSTLPPNEKGVLKG